MNDIKSFQEERNQSITHQVNFGEKTIGYLYLSNAGAIVALSGYLAHRESPGLLPCWRMSAILFCIGLMFSIVSIALAYYFQTQVTTYTNQSQRIAIYNDLYGKYILSENKEIKAHIFKILEQQYIFINKNPYVPPNNILFTGCIIAAALSALFFILGFFGIILTT